MLDERLQEVIFKQELRSYKQWMAVWRERWYRVKIMTQSLGLNKTDQIK